MIEIDSSHLSPPQVVLDILANLKDLSTKIDINLNPLDFVSIDDRNVQEGEAFIDINDRALNQCIKHLEAEVEDKQSTAVNLLDRTVTTIFDEKIELFQMLKEIDPKLEFPVAEWFEHTNLENALGQIKYLDLNLDRYSLYSFQHSHKSILNYALKNTYIIKSYDEIANGNIDSIAVIENSLVAIKDLPWEVFNTQDKKNENVNFFETLNDRNFARNALRRYLFLKEFSKNPYDLKAPSVLELQKFFPEKTIPEYFMMELLEINSIKSQHFLFMNNAENKVTPENTISIIQDSLMSHCKNLNKIFPEYVKTNDFEENLVRLLSSLLNIASRNGVSAAKESNSIIKDRILMEISIPVNDLTVSSKALKF